jgi:putative zinc finger protein
VTTIDPFEHDDAAFVLNALPEPERTVFEAHLATCAACTGRVNALAATSVLLADITAADVAEPAPEPDTLLPGLLRRAAAARRRQRWLVNGLGGLAAACLIALAVALWPTSHTSQPSHQPAPQALSALTASPLHAAATVTDRKWGTQINLDCRYSGNGDASTRITYALRIIDRAGATHDLGTWTVQPGTDTTFTSGTALPRGQISSIEITRPDGTPILHLTT